MTVLSDHDINWYVQENLLKIQTYDVTQVQPASYDVKLGSKFRIFNLAHTKYIDPLSLDPELMRAIDVGADGQFLLRPGGFVLGMTEEVFVLPDVLCARIEGKSSLGRLGLVIHSTAGWIDPGFSGRITLELSNSAHVGIILRPGMLIGQMAFMYLSSRCVTPYGHPSRKSKYQGQMEPTESRYGQ